MITIFIYHFVRFRYVCACACKRHKQEEERQKNTERKTRRVSVQRWSRSNARDIHNHQKETKILNACYTSNLGAHKHINIHMNGVFFFSILLEKWSHNQRLVVVVVIEYMPFRRLQTTVPFADFFFFYLSLSLFCCIQFCSCIFLLFYSELAQMKQVQNSNSQRYISHRSMTTPINAAVCKQKKRTLQSQKMITNRLRACAVVTRKILDLYVLQKSPQPAYIE